MVFDFFFSVPLLQSFVLFTSWGPPSVTVISGFYSVFGSDRVGWSQVDAVDSTGFTPVAVAACLDHTQTVEVLPRSALKI